MFTRVLRGGAVTALAGVAMLAISASSASAFTLSSPSIEQPMASSNIDHVWCNGWGCGGWHRGWGPGWHRGWGPGWGGPGYRHCWRGPWGHLHCNW
jgi:hypothetical protein